MKIVIDSNVCLQNGLTLGDVLLLTTLKFNDSFEKSMEELTKEGLITRYGIPIGPISVTQAGLDKIQAIICESQENAPKKRDLEALAAKLQEVYPAGKKEGFYWRGTKKEIATRLQRFLTLYGKKWTDEEIIDATKYYVSQHENDPYMRLLKYFILKEGSSDLAEILENKGQEDSTMSDFRSTLI